MAIKECMFQQEGSIDVAITHNFRNKSEQEEREILDALKNIICSN